MSNDHDHDHDNEQVGCGNPLCPVHGISEAEWREGFELAHTFLEQLSGKPGIVGMTAGVFITVLAAKNTLGHNPKNMHRFKLESGGLVEDLKPEVVGQLMDALRKMFLYAFESSPLELDDDQTGTDTLSRMTGGKYDA